MAVIEFTNQASDPADRPMCTVSCFGPTEAALLLNNLSTARAIFRAVLLAVKAQIDESVNYKDNSVTRWNFAVEVACLRLEAVRDVLIQSAAAPSVDWFTSLTLAEAISAALWHGAALPQCEKISAPELESLAQVVIETCDSLVLECLKAGMPSMNPTQAAGR